MFPHVWWEFIHNTNKTVQDDTCGHSGWSMDFCCRMYADLKCILQITEVWSNKQQSF